MKIIVSKDIKIKTALIMTLVFVFSGLFAGAKLVMDKLAIDASSESVLYSTIIVDAGHGGPDGGTSADDGTLEKDLNLQIAHKLNNILRSMGYETVMTRDEDISIHDDSATSIRQKKISDLRNRLDIINNTENSLFVSIHQNHYSSAEYSGTQVFYSDNNPDSYSLASSIRLPVTLCLQPDNTREIKKSGSEIFLLNNAHNPAVMVECGFLSNYEETQKLKDSDYQGELAFVIALGIADFINNTED